MNIEEFVNDYLQEHRHDVLLNPYNGLMEFAKLVCEWQKKPVEGLDEAAYTIPLKLLAENKASYGLDSTGTRYPMDCFKAGAEWAFSRFEKVALSDDLYIKK